MAVIVNLTQGVITPPADGLLFMTAVPTRVSITDLTREMPHTLASSKADCAGPPGLRTSRRPFFDQKSVPLTHEHHEPAFAEMAHVMRDA